MNKELRVFRTERKYPLSNLQGSGLYSKLSAVMSGDSFNGTNAYMVRSLYFDTIYHDDYFEKMAGVERRRKIRLRIYDVNAPTAKLEIKEKQGANQLKRSLTVTRQEAEMIQQGDYTCLLAKEEPLAAELFYLMTTKQYRPVCIVEYKRRAFMAITNDIRITFDSEIRSNEGNYNIFDKNLQTYPVYSMGDTILEVKYNGFLLSYIKDMIGTIDCNESASSKYCMARTFGLG